MASAGKVKFTSEYTRLMRDVRESLRGAARKAVSATVRDVAQRVRQNTGRLRDDPREARGVDPTEQTLDERPTLQELYSDISNVVLPGNKADYGDRTSVGRRAGGNGRVVFLIPEVRSFNEVYTGGWGPYTEWDRKTTVKWRRLSDGSVLEADPPFIKWRADEFGMPARTITPIDPTTPPTRLRIPPRNLGDEPIYPRQISVPAIPPSMFLTNIVGDVRAIAALLNKTMRDEFKERFAKKQPKHSGVGLRKARTGNAFHVTAPLSAPRTTRRGARR